RPAPLTAGRQPVLPADHGVPASAGSHHVITLRVMRPPARLAVPPLVGAVLVIGLAAVPASAASKVTVPVAAVAASALHARRPVPEARARGRGRRAGRPRRRAPPVSARWARTWPTRARARSYGAVTRTPNGRWEASPRS